MATKQKKDFKNKLSLITPKIRVFIIRLDSIEAKKLIEIGITNQELRKFKTKMFQDELRSTPVFDIKLMHLNLNGDEITQSNEILQKSYDEGLKNHMEYIEDLNRIVGPSDLNNVTPKDYIEMNLNNQDFSIVFDRFYQESTYVLDMDDDFDPTKIHCYVEELYLEDGKEYLSCYWKYESKNFLYRFNAGLTKEDCYILSTTQRRFNLKFI
jgi:hypothetical protein